jgi:pseudaminic acid synthase
MKISDLIKERVFIIAEISANHHHDYNLTIDTIHAIADSGANAVKVQTFKPESLSMNINNPYFGPRQKGAWKGMRPYDLYKEAMMPWEWQPELKKKCEELGLIFFSSPFDFEAVDFLESMSIPLYKIASFEITDIPLIRRVAIKGKPIILSTGLAALDDIDLALETCIQAGNAEIALLKCTSQYPATIEAANLKTIPDMKNRWNVEVGVSDHTLGSIVPVVAVSLGARIVEKHFILNRKMGGLDASFSMEPSEFKKMVDDVRNAENAIGEIVYDIPENDKLRRRSLFIVEDIKKGEMFTDANIKSIRPGNGLAPKFIDKVIGRNAKMDLQKGTPLEWKMIH